LRNFTNRRGGANPWSTEPTGRCDRVSGSGEKKRGRILSSTPTPSKASFKKSQYQALTPRIEGIEKMGKEKYKKGVPLGWFFRNSSKGREGTKGSPQGENVPQVAERNKGRPGTKVLLDVPW